MEEKRERLKGEEEGKGERKKTWGKRKKRIGG